MTTKWYVRNFDGDVRLGPFERQRDAVKGILLHTGALILQRRKYGPGDYEYIVGFEGADRAATWMVVSQRAASFRDLTTDAGYPL